MRVLASLLLAGSLAWGASPRMAPPPDSSKAPDRAGTANKAEPPNAPAKKAVEEPVFRMPELVIIGENQARIMAQKERVSGSPLAGLHEAPLLEKEEGVVTALRQRESAPTNWGMKPGRSLLVRAEVGTHGAMAGDAWLGFLGDREMNAYELAGSSWKGEKAGAGYSAGWDAQASWGGSQVVPPKPGARAKWTDLFMPWKRADTRDFTLGWQGAGRELPWAGQENRRMNRAFVEGEVARNPEDFSARALAEGVWVDSPRGGDRGFHVTDTMDGTIWSRERVAVRTTVRLEGEAARRSGNAGIAGSDLTVAWVPGGRFRYIAGLRGDVAGTRDGSARSLRPLAGASWEIPGGPAVQATLSGGLDLPLFGEQAAAVPYSYFTAAPVPERELANFALGARYEAWDASALAVELRVRELRGALSWAEGSGALYSPANVGRLSVMECRISSRYNGWKGFSAGGTATLRNVSGEDGAATGLPRAEALLEGEWRHLAFKVGADLEVQLARNRSVAGGRLAPFESLGLGGSWTPRPYWEVFVKARNLLADDIERWGGYPEPKRQLTGGLTAKF